MSQFVPELTGFAALRQIVEFFNDPVEMAKLSLAGAVTEFGDVEGRVGMSPSVLGGGPGADQLGQLHQHAFDIYTETLGGVREDLETFLDAFKQIQTSYLDTDDEHAQSMAARQAAIRSFTQAGNSDHGDRANDDARNHPHEGD